MKQKMMFLALTLWIMSAASVNAQVNIGSSGDPHKGAVLDLSQSSNELGVLFPRVYIFNTKDFTLPVDDSVEATGMIVYNSNVSLTDGAGLYAWNGSEWKSMSSGVNSCVPVTATATTVKTESNAKITVTVTSGNPTFSYIWSKEEVVVRTTTNVTAVSDSYTTIGAGTYTVTVTNPCTATPVSFIFDVDVDGEILTDNGNGTYTDSKGNLIYNGKTYTPVESDIPYIYLDENSEIVYTGADDIPGNADDDVFVVPDYPLPTQETLFSVKYPPGVLHKNGEYQMELDFADGRIYANTAIDTYTGKIKFVSGNSSVISVDENGKMTACSTDYLSATIAIILENGSVFYYKPSTRPALSYNKLAGVMNSEIIVGQGLVKKIEVSLRDNNGGTNAWNLKTLTYAINPGDDGGTGSTVTSGGWFQAGATPGAATVTATATDEENNTVTGTVTVTVLGNPSAEALPYETASTGWATLDPAPAYAGGDGTEANPFQISSVRQFKKLATDIALLGSTEATYQKYFELTADLDFLADNTVTNTLIGAFYGTFDGKGHLIKDLNIDGTGKASISLFGELSYGEIKNLGREGGSITDTDATPIVMAGGIIYSMRNGGKLKNCYNSSSIVNTRLGSGLVGVWAMIGGSIENCYNTGNIAAKEFIGGLTASALGGGGNISVTNCYNFGDVTGGNRYSIGGLIGLFNDSNGNKQTLNANNVFNFGSVSSPNATASFGRIGSILGSMNETNSALVEINATNVYSRPDVASTNNGTTNKFNRPIGWGSTAGETLKNAILAANPTLGEDLKYTLEYGKSTDFVTELGGAFKYAPGRTPKLAWER